MDETRICLYGLDNPVLIVPAKTGVVYYNQVEGCGCSQKEQEGYIIPLPKIDLLKHTCFNPVMWYDKAHSSTFVPRNIKSSTDKEKEKKVFHKWCEAAGWAESKMSILQATAYMYEWESKNWFNSVMEQIEGMDQELNMKIRILRREKQMEAWFQVRFFDGGYFSNSGKQWKRAILTWQNSD